MADEFYLDPDKFRVVSRDLGQAGTDLKAAQQRLSGILVQYTGAWGSDDIGKAFETNYYANAEMVRTGAGTAGDGIVDSARSAQQSADNLASVDEESAKKLDAQTETE
jgi:hypothetical protein